MRAPAHPLRSIYNGMISRCSNPQDSGYRNYGAIGVEVCNRWLVSFDDFVSDVGARPSVKYSLDRFPDPSGDYMPGNVRWATARMQGRNKRETRRATINGRTQSIQDWIDAARAQGIVEPHPSGTPATKQNFLFSAASGPSILQTVGEVTPDSDLYFRLLTARNHAIRLGVERGDLRIIAISESEAIVGSDSLGMSA